MIGGRRLLTLAAVLALPVAVAYALGTLEERDAERLRQWRETAVLGHFEARAALAERLGLDPQTPRDCRRDGHVPYGAIVTAVRAGVLAVDLHWLFTGGPCDDGVRCA